MGAGAPALPMTYARAGRLPVATGHTEDAYGALDYRGLIAWPERLAREAPLLERVLSAAPERTLLDLGSGTGEHARFLRDRGHRVTGVDASLAQVQSARASDASLAPEARIPFLHGDLASVGDLVPGAFGAAICLGNTLPHLTDTATLQRFLSGLASHLLPGAPFLLQLLNYDRILDRGERSLPLMLRPGPTPGEELVFLRLMTHGEGGRLTFTPATLRHRPGAEAPLEVISAQPVQLQAWRRADLLLPLEKAGFVVREVCGDMLGGPWTPTSSDLVLVAVRA